jgi:dTMP kinase
MDLREKDRLAGEIAGPAGDFAELNESLLQPGPEARLASDIEMTTSSDGGDHDARSDSNAKSLLYHPHPYPGRLIAVEGIDGSGKSTQLLLLERWLRTRGYPVHFTEWNSSRLVRRSMSRGKKKNLLTPTTFSLLHAVDFADRLTYQILPPLKAGMIVLADRYVYTAFARDVARGVHPEWVRQVYSFALRPDLTLYFKVPIEISLERLLAGRAKLKYHEAGMDVTHALDPVESFRGFQSRVLAIYDQLSGEFGLKPIDATGEIPAQQRLVRRMVQEVLVDYDCQRAQGNHGLTSQAR